MMTVSSIGGCFIFWSMAIITLMVWFVGLTLLLVLGEALYRLAQQIYDALKEFFRWLLSILQGAWY